MNFGLRTFVLLASVCVWVADDRAALFAAEPAKTVPDRILFSTGIAGVFDGERNAMLAVELRGGVELAGVHPWLSVGWATDGGTFIGGGALYTVGEEHTWHASIGFGPGYYERNQGRDLGKHLEFLSFFEISHTLQRGHDLVLRLAHISNGSLSDHNPGTELLTVGYLVPLGWAKGGGGR